MPEGLMTPRQAAALLGVSYVTLKSWILRGSLQTVKTPGGHHRIEASALAAFHRQAPLKRGPQISGRNQLVGVVSEVTVEGLLARVRIRLGEQVITAIITAEAVREMKLKKGDQAAALIKATEVMVEKFENE
jgi:molybdopterin-binding protein